MPTILVRRLKFVWSNSQNEPGAKHADSGGSLQAQIVTGAASRKKDCMSHLAFHLMPFTLMLSALSAACYASECKIPGWGYAVHDSHVYYGWRDPSSASVTDESIVADADPLTFVAIDHACTEAGPLEPPTVLDRFGKDKKFVFLDRRKIKGADPASFELMDYSHEKDKSYVYYMGERISNRPAEFHHLDDHSSYATDGKYFYYGSNKMLADGFVIFQENKSYAKNKTTVFHAGVPVIGADPATFTLSVTNTPITKDKRHVFYDDKLIPGADAATFKEIGYAGMGMDKNAVYIETQRFSDIGTDGLRVSEFSEYLINNHAVYEIVSQEDAVLLKKLQDADPETFHALGAKWGKDSQRVYYHNNIVPQADPDSFVLTGVDSAQDRAYEYVDGKILCTRSPDAASGMPQCAPSFQ